MKSKTAIWCIILLCTSLSGFAQTSSERNLIRRGNKAYRDSSFIDADVFYKKALDKNPRSAIASYNMGNSLLLQMKPDDAMKNYQNAMQVETDKTALSQIFHNTGIINYLSAISQAEGEHQAAVDALKKAVEDYKQSLRRNPTDNETRYNLAMAQKMLQDQQQQQEQQKQEEKKQDEQQKKDEKKNDEKKQNPEQEKKSKQQSQPKISKESAEQMLNAVMQNEKETQEKLQKRMQAVQDTPLQKDW